MNRSRSSWSPVALTAAALAVLALVGGCSSGGRDDKSSASGSSASTTNQATVERAPAAADALTAAKPASGGTAADSTGASDVVEQRSVIAKGSLDLSTASVDEARRRARDVVTTAGGVVASEQTESDDHGRARNVDLVLRVPVTRFDHVLDALAGLGRLEHRSQSAEDVTTQAIDIGSRVRAQRASVASIERLYARATTIGEVMSIEAQLARRQAALDSLERQQKWLADQTALGTISMSISRTAAGTHGVKAAGPAGFVEGLEDGWDALATIGRGLAVAVGALLPFAGLLVVLGVPAWLLLRRRRRPGATPAAG